MPRATAASALLATENSSLEFTSERQLSNNFDLESCLDERTRHTVAKLDFFGR
ncbi:hypothetical protein AB0300_16560 [Microbacterium sp. NPDC078814]|uniref:hypothetical protein n=1 Tax=Microbacterium sp. NPDC078814 TaxID=3154767 RepID=UPI00344D17F2